MGRGGRGRAARQGKTTGRVGGRRRGGDTEREREGRVEEVEEGTAKPD